MTGSDFTITLVTDKTPKEAFKAITNVRGWWTEELEGHSENLKDEFTVRFFDDIHVSTQRLIEVIPDKKIVWLVTKSKLTFLKNQTEWTGTTISFEITEKNSKTEIIFIHHGLVAEIECYMDCSNGWSQYIGSLFNLLTTGKGQPELKSA